RSVQRHLPAAARGALRPEPRHARASAAAQLQLRGPRLRPPRLLGLRGRPHRGVRPCTSRARRPHRDREPPPAVLAAPPAEDPRPARPDPPAVHPAPAGADRLGDRGPAARDRPRRRGPRDPAHGPRPHGLLDPPPGTARSAVARSRTQEDPSAPAVLTSPRSVPHASESSAPCPRSAVRTSSPRREGYICHTPPECFACMFEVMAWAA